MNKITTVQCVICNTTFQPRWGRRDGAKRFCSMACYQKDRISPTHYKERLLAKRALNPETGCWDWTGVKNLQGYGRLLINRHLIFTHRLSAHVYLGMDLKSTQYVCHTCDRPSCFSPDHLYLGNALTNAKDKSLRGKPCAIKGEASNLAKLTEAQVIKIIQCLNLGQTHASIAAKFQVGSSTIGMISNGSNWAHIPRN